MNTSSVNLAQSERALLADLFDKVGPDQPTLNAGWQTSDLLLHLLMRERRPDAAIGMFVKPFAFWTARVSRGYATLPWTEQVEMFRTGPKGLSPIRIDAVDKAMNSGEYLIHHEDVLRGAKNWQPREFDEATTAVIVKMLTSPPFSWGFRNHGVGITGRLPDGRPLTLHSGEPHVVLHGAPVELLLWASGRRTECHVRLEGDPDALATLAKSLAKS
ncbi:TIGR03085 family protein [Nakamurella antarctica]|uniref:TIGR03085 family protein n=1 Tax=Nakamurella antarctica TaxID=1902245 RepID=A0A3G8ZVN7_9ACTN|nr:TIGR03085 family metal-binding protein [Nakamurella antarctica]AZI58076.1 TIGR03085 family protein [Nakamurella antarctica]